MPIGFKISIIKSKILAMIKPLFFSVILYLLVISCNPPTGSSPVGKPKLVVGIMVDQMRYNYLTRYADKYSEQGFKRFYNQGFVLKNGHFNYVPTVTGCGHAAVFTGATPSGHGIIANTWYDRATKKRVYCVDDSTVTTLGSDSETEKYSPRNLLSTTITDELKMATNMKSKVVGVSLKNRGAILPLGGSADGAFWYDGKNGKFVTSTFYYDEFPEWAVEFNNLDLPDQYLNQTWNTLLPIEEYTESGPDDSPHERILKGKVSPTFPYDLSSLRADNGNYDLLTLTPYGNTYLKEFAKTAIKAEQMGQDEVTDFILVDFSTPDYSGHAFGTFYCPVFAGQLPVSEGRD